MRQTVDAAMDSKSNADRRLSDIRETPSRPTYSLLFLYTKFVLVLGNIFRSQDVFTARVNIREHFGNLSMCSLFHIPVSAEPDDF